VTHLRKMMLEELQRRNYTDLPRVPYLRVIEDLARYFTVHPINSSGTHSRVHGPPLCDRKTLRQTQ